MSSPLNLVQKFSSTFWRLWNPWISLFFFTSPGHSISNSCKRVQNAICNLSSCLISANGNTSSDLVCSELGLDAPPKSPRPRIQLCNLRDAKLLESIWTFWGNAKHVQMFQTTQLFNQKFTATKRQTICLHILCLTVESEHSQYLWLWKIRY